MEPPAIAISPQWFGGPAGYGTQGVKAKFQAEYVGRFYWLTTDLLSSKGRSFPSMMEDATKTEFTLGSAGSSYRFVVELMGRPWFLDPIITFGHIFSQAQRLKIRLFME